jgi:hypothetical protein
MRPGTSEVHHLDMENFNEARQLIIDLRRKREAEACRRRLAKADAGPVTCSPQPERRQHHILGFARHALAGG